MSESNPQPTKETLLALESLKQAVSKALDRKRRLGQYAVVFEGNRTIYLGADTDRPEDPTADGASQN